MTFCVEKKHSVEEEWNDALYLRVYVLGLACVLPSVDCRTANLLRVFYRCRCLSPFPWSPYRILQQLLLRQLSASQFHVSHLA